MKKVCIVTGSRAEYGLLYLLIKGIQKSKKLKLQLVVTGMHLSHEFGETYKEIEKDGFKIDYKIETLLSSDTSVSISKSVGLGIISFAEVFEQIKPDLLIVLGDRFEILSAATAAMISRIPIAHLHGGESTEGAIDEAIRHAITKMSHLHFVSTNEYKKRVIQLGENPSNVYNVGALGVDNIIHFKPITKTKFEKDIKFIFGNKNILVTYHPETLESTTAESQMLQILHALESLTDTNILFTFSNADNGGREINNLIKEFVSKHNNCSWHISLGRARYLSALSYVDMVVGNSSSGIIEVPYFKIPTINIGERQKGRVKANSIIDCECRKSSILKAIKIAYSETFKSKIRKQKLPYGNGKTHIEIINILESAKSDILLKKSFHDL